MAEGRGEGSNVSDVAEYRQLGARVSPAAYEGLLGFCGHMGVSASGLLEALGLELGQVVQHADDPVAWAEALGVNLETLSAWVDKARAIDLERRRRS